MLWSGMGQTTIKDINFSTHPSTYKHWKLTVEQDIATLAMNVEPHGGLAPDYELKLNSYDLGVDIELQDAIHRVRFEYPHVRTVIVTSGTDRVFCAGANIHMLAGSTHSFKVNFCKYTNETRLSIEDASRHSGINFLAALNGSTAGGGYELALACDEILLIDDGNSSVSLPEVPLLAVLPGTGGLTRVVDKRHVRRDRADVFCTLSEGMRGKRAVEWKLVDAIAPRSKFPEATQAHAKTMVQKSLANLKTTGDRNKGITLDAITPNINEHHISYSHVDLKVHPELRTAELWVSAPKDAAPCSAAEFHNQGCKTWALQMPRELEDALFRLRFLYPDVGVVSLYTQGDGQKVLEWDRAVDAHKQDWYVNEILLYQARVYRRLDLTAKSFFAFIDQKSAFSGSLFEMALSADRIYMLADDDEKVSIELGPLNGGPLNGGPLVMSHGRTRLENRFEGNPESLKAILAHKGPIHTKTADALGLLTFAPDEIDWEDDVRIAIEERASLSPDALTGMEASLRFVGPETPDSKIFARLSAWQNWIFQRPNAVGPEGALTKYGEPERPQFSWTRC